MPRWVRCHGGLAISVRLGARRRRTRLKASGPLGRACSTPAGAPPHQRLRTGPIMAGAQVAQTGAAALCRVSRNWSIAARAHSEL